VAATGHCTADSRGCAAPGSAGKRPGRDHPHAERIRQNGAIYVGHRESSVPFSYLVGDLPVGYSMDLCQGIVAAVRAKLGTPALPVVHVPANSSTRLLLLMTGAIDLECGSTTNTRTRQNQVAFSVTTYVSGIKALVRKDGGLERLADLNGRRSDTAGTTTERAVRTAMAARNASVRFKSGRDHGESLLMIVSRHVDAFALDDAVLAGLLSGLPDREQYKLLEENFGLEPYAIAMRKDDPDFKKLVDDALIAMMGSGEMERLYEKWFTSPIPPNKVNLRIPMSDMLRGMLRNPSDAGIQ
jgi:glutamate/aspartate transport system substrate-binding protein